MIEITTKYTCDRCKKESGENCEFFKIKTQKVDTKVLRPASNYRFCSDGIVSDFYDDYASYHLCSDCKNLMQGFMSGS